MPQFQYSAQTLDGHALTGNLTAEDQPAAQKLLETLHLRVLSLSEESTASPPRRSLSSTDFQAFNTQLAHLTAAGLPVERGLRLIAQDLRSGRLAKTTQAVADEMAAGASPDEAFSRHERQFPPLYSRLVRAGIKTNNLPGMLLNLSRHVQLVTQLRAALWRAVAYPFVLFIGLAFVVTFLSIVVLPKFQDIFNDFRTDLPAITRWVLVAGPYAPWIALVVVLILFGIPVLMEILRAFKVKTSASDILLHVPVLGKLLNRSLLSRWCDALHLGVAAGLPLPEGLRLAGDAVGSHPLSRDSQILADAVASGHTIETSQRLAVVTPAVISAIALGSEQNNLPAVLGNLSNMYEQQARQRLANLPAMLTALLMAIIAAIMFVVISAMFLPLVRLVQSVSGGG